MANTAIRLTCADYARLSPLMTGDVALNGADLTQTEALMGVGFHQDGFERNRAAIEAFCQQAFDLGITKRRVTAEEYFAEFLES